jgi:hypothetical protein
MKLIMRNDYGYVKQATSLCLTTTDSGNIFVEKLETSPLTALLLILQNEYVLIEDGSPIKEWLVHIVDSEGFTAEDNEITSETILDGISRGFIGFSVVIWDDQPAIRCFDFRYTDTLRICFNYPLGIGSYGDCDSMDEIHRDYLPELSSVEFKYYAEKFDDVCDAFRAVLSACKSKDDIELDWRDGFELEIHHIDSSKFHSGHIESLNVKLFRILKNER